jgi:hypothetical protein
MNCSTIDPPVERQRLANGDLRAVGSRKEFRWSTRLPRGSPLINATGRLASTTNISGRAALLVDFPCGNGAALRVGVAINLELERSP